MFTFHAVIFLRVTAARYASRMNRPLQSPHWSCDSTVIIVSIEASSDLTMVPETKLL